MKNLKTSKYNQQYLLKGLTMFYIKTNNSENTVGKIKSKDKKHFCKDIFLSDKSLRANLVILSSSCLLEKFCPSSLLLTINSSFIIFYSDLKMPPDLKMPQPTISKCYTETLTAWYTEQPADGTLQEMNECQLKWSSTESKKHSILNFSVSRRKHL